MKIYIAYTLSQTKPVLHTEFHGNRFSRSPVMPAQTDRQTDTHTHIHTHTQTDRQERISKMWFSFSAQLIVHVSMIYFKKIENYNKMFCYIDRFWSSTLINLFSLVSAFSQKNKTYKIGLGVCVCVCVYSFGPPLTISIPVMRLIRNFGYI